MLRYESFYIHNRSLFTVILPVTSVVMKIFSAKCDRGRPEESRSTANEAMDPMLVRSLLEQLLPLLCDVFQVCEHICTFSK